MGEKYFLAKVMGLKKRDSHFNSNVLLEVLFSFVHKKDLQSPLWESLRGWSIGKVFLCNKMLNNYEQLTYARKTMG